MNLSKSLLWVVNVSIAIITLAGSAQIYYSAALLISKGWQIEISEEDRGDAEAYSASLGLSEMDVEYAYRSADGKVLLDSYFLVFDNVKLLDKTKEVDFFLNERRNYLTPPRAFDSQHDLYDEREISFIELFVPVERGELKRILIFRILIYMVLLAAALFILFGLRRFIIKTGENEFFDKTNYLLLMRIGLTLFVYTVVRFAGYSYFEWLVTDRMSQSLSGNQSILFQYQFQWEFAASGLLLVLISLAFKQGVVLKEEQSLTI